MGLGYIYEITKDPIAQMEADTRLAAYSAVFPEASGFEDIDNAVSESGGIPADAGITGVDIDSAVRALDASGNGIGYVINITTKEGYGGDISLSLGVDDNGTVKGIEILSISETAGLGMKAKEAAFRDQFRNKAVTQFTYSKTGASADFEIDAISGATITTKAVTNAVNGGLAFFRSIGGER